MLARAATGVLVALTTAGALAGLAPNTSQVAQDCNGGMIGSGTRTCDSPAQATTVVLAQSCGGGLMGSGARTCDGSDATTTGSGTAG